MDGLAALRPLEPRRVGVPRRRGVEHGAAADGRLAAQHDAVAARGDDRRGEPQLRVRSPARTTRAGTAASRGGRAGARRRDRLELLERDVEPVARREGARRDERVAAPQLAPLDARGARARRAAGLGALDRAVVHLDAADAHLAPPGSARSTSPSPIEPDQSVPVATVPIPRSEKTRST